MNNPKEQNSIFVTEIEVKDPDTGNPVPVEIHKDPQSGGIFGIDATFTDQVSDQINSPFTGTKIHLSEPTEEPIIFQKLITLYKRRGQIQITDGLANLKAVFYSTDHAVQFLLSGQLRDEYFVKDDIRGGAYNLYRCLDIYGNLKKATT